MSQEEIWRRISTMLDQLVRLTAVLVARGLKPNEAIIALGQAGLDRNVIANTVGTTAATVSVRLSEAKSKKSKDGKKPAKKTPRRRV
jgi:hypothetical protein